jgi:site-specific DNA-cytosine methylase
MSVGKKEKINVLSLFDGISCGQIALERAGIEVENYFASEIEPSSIKVTQANFPNTKQLGSVLNVKGADLPKIDLLIGGSPCQGFSFAGKQLNFEDPRSKLFFEFIRIFKEINPTYFLLENVKMKQEYQDIISDYLGVNPIMINSNLVSAQNRTRLYWTNIPNIEQPTDKNIKLSDILETEYEYYKCRATVQKNAEYTDIKSVTLTAAMGMGGGNVPMLISKEFYEKHKGKYIDGNDRKGLRLLTPVECERLQTVPDNYTSCVSKTHRYKALGNGWTVDVIAFIFSFLKGEEIFNNFSNENIN